MRLSPQFRRAFAAALLALLAVSHAWGQANSTTGSAVKAAFLFKFASFVEWPAGTFARPDQPLVISEMGDDEVAADLEQIVTGRTVEGHPVVARRVADVASARGSQMLFVGRGREGLQDVADAVAGPVLVVADRPAGLRMGAVLNFSEDAGRIRFSASLVAAEARGLKLSSRLLAVAQAVESRVR
jgi:hypothetical protein